MASSMRVYNEIIREGMDHYWRVIATRTDEGLDATERQWKRDHARDIARFEKKFGRDLQELCGKL